MICNTERWKEVNIKCDDITLPEFPQLLFGVGIDGTNYFDATYYLQNNDPEQHLSVDDFISKFDRQINAIANTYRLKDSQLFVTDQDGHLLIGECLCYLFLSYVDPDFCVYVVEMINELLTTGIVVSDSYMIEQIRKRFTTEVLKRIILNG